MSVPTTANGLLWTTGDDQVGIDVESGINWANGDWTLLQSAVPADYAVAAVTTSNLPIISGITNVESVLELGWGFSVDAVCIIADWPITISSPAPGAWDVVLPVPRQVPEGVNLYLRYRTSDAVNPLTLPNCAVGYYAPYDNLATHSTTLSFYRDPSAADGTEIDFTGVSWDWTAWTEVSSGPASDAYFGGLSILPSNSAHVYTETEFEVGVGAGPTSIGTIAVQANSVGSLMLGWLPRVVPVAEGTPISVRMRAVTTITDGVLVAPLYYADPPSECGTCIIVIKQNQVAGDTTSFDFGTNGAPLTPTTFSLADGESQTFLAIPAGSGYAINENVPDHWTVTYTVSNGSPVDNITVAAGEVVTVTAINTFNPPAQTFPVRRLRQFALPTDEHKQIFIQAIELEFQRGMGLNDGQGDDPQIMLSLSKDGGKTWGPEHWLSAGKQGEYDRRAIWYQLGQARNPVVRIVVTDPIFWAFQDCYLKARPGTS